MARNTKEQRRAARQARHASVKHAHSVREVARQIDELKERLRQERQANKRRSYHA